MTDAAKTTLVGCFASPSTARDALGALLQQGADRETVGLLAVDSAEARGLLEEGPGSPGEGAAIGAAAGGTLFGLAAIALATGPGVLAIGPFAAMLGGATAGAGAGGLLGSLVGLGIPEHEAALRAEEIRKGGVLVTCGLPAEDTEEHARRFSETLTGHGAREVFRV